MFIAYVNETDNGCDYTIACGKVLWELGAQTRDGAVLEVKERASDYDRNELVSVTLFEVHYKAEMPIHEWRAEIDRMRENAMEQQLEEQEQREHERLKRKYDTS